MAFHISRNVGYGSNTTPNPAVYSTFKYWFYIDCDVDVVGMSGDVATIRVYGTYRVVNSTSGGPANVRAASDFAVLAGGSWDRSAHAFNGENYYMRALPCMPNADSDLLNNKMLLEFRGDTYRPNGNHSSVWAKGGTINPNYDGSTFDRSYNFDKTFTITIPAAGDVPIITWTTSGWGGPTAYEWLVQETWASWFDLKWDATLHFDANGGSNAPADIVHEATGGAETITIPDTVPTWEWHRFDGWADTRDGNPRYHAGDTITIDKNSPTKTIYAIWTEWYRVGDVRYSSTFRTTHRSGGKCHIRQNEAWVEMRSIDAGQPTPIDPPNRYYGGRWQNQYKIGQP